MKISIVILNWNGGNENCSDAVRSALSQDYADKEIIFVDNGSTDGSYEYVMQQFEDLKFIQTGKNLGCPGGRNVGGLAATGELIFFLENDGYWEDNGFVTAAVKKFQDYPHLGALYTKVIAPSTGKADLSVNHTSYEIHRVKEQGLLLASSFRGGASVVRRGLFAELEGFAGDFIREVEEMELSYRIYDKGFLIAYWPDYTMVHKGSDYVGKSIQVGRKAFINEIKTYARRFPLAEAVMFLPYKIAAWTLRLVMRRDFPGIKEVYLQLPAALLSRSRHQKISAQSVQLVEAIMYSHVTDYAIKPEQTVADLYHSAPTSNKIKNRLIKQAGA